MNVDNLMDYSKFVGRLHKIGQVQLGLTLPLYSFLYCRDNECVIAYAVFVWVAKHSMNICIVHISNWSKYWLSIIESAISLKENNVTDFDSNLKKNLYLDFWFYERERDRQRDSER